jgi:CubicO group peptidase (beta-lactamase class C family)
LTGALAAGISRDPGRQARIIMGRPANEWTFTHMNRLFPSEVVRRAGPVAPLPARRERLNVRYTYGGSEFDLAQFHRRTYTTAFVVLHRGRLVHESYPGAFAGPRTRFQAFSLTKSLTSMLIGIALSEGLVTATADPVTRYLPALRGTSYDGVTIGHLLDMTSGVGDLEDWTDPGSDINRFSNALFTGQPLIDVVSSAKRTAQPGTRFNYSTLDAQVLGWVLEAATGSTLARWASARIWSRIGAELDGYYWLTREDSPTALGGGSFNATARDLARLGLLMAHDGVFGDQQIVPREWVARSRGGAAGHLAVGALGAGGLDHYGYANQWWTLGGERRSFTGIGIHGQYLYVDPVADVVVVKCSAWPTQDDEGLDTETIAAIQATIRYLETPQLETVGALRRQPAGAHRRAQRRGPGIGGDRDHEG